MADLYLREDRLESVFQLLGEYENDITYSVAWCLAKCPFFLREFLPSSAGWNGDTEKVVIGLQQYERDRGFTDIEIRLRDKFYLIVEAKRGWYLPGSAQLKKYATRPSFVASEAPLKQLVVLTECSHAYSMSHLEVKEIEGIRVEPVSWKELAAMAMKVQEKGSYSERNLIRELLTYLKGVMTVQKVDSNSTFVVSLAQGTPPGWRISWIDIVEKRKRYFHPVGTKGWPKDPPTYIAFRYSGKLQSIHHIESYEVFTNPHEVMPEIPIDEWGPHYFYKLGPAFGPSKDVKSGSGMWNKRVTCALDTLLTCNSVAEAFAVSQKRKGQVS